MLWYSLLGLVPLLMMIGFVVILVFLKRIPEDDENKLKQYKKALIILRVVIVAMAVMLAGLVVLLIFTINK